MDRVGFSWATRSVLMCGFHVSSLSQCCCCLLVRSRNEVQDSVYIWLPQGLRCVARVSKYMFLSQALKPLPLHINPLCISCWMLPFAFLGSNKAHSYVSPNPAFSKSVLATTKSPSPCPHPLTSYSCVSLSYRLEITGCNAKQAASSPGHEQFVGTMVSFIKRGEQSLWEHVWYDGMCRICLPQRKKESENTRARSRYLELASEEEGLLGICEEWNQRSVGRQLHLCSIWGGSGWACLRAESPGLRNCSNRCLGLIFGSSVFLSSSYTGGC